MIYVRITYTAKEMFQNLLTDSGKAILFEILTLVKKYFVKYLHWQRNTFLNTYTGKEMLMVDRDLGPSSFDPKIVDPTLHTHTQGQVSCKQSKG